MPTSASARLMLMGKKHGSKEMDKKHKKMGVKSHEEMMKKGY